MSPATTPNAILPSTWETLETDVPVKLEPVSRVKFRSPGPKAIQLNVNRKNRRESPAVLAARPANPNPNSIIPSPANTKTKRPSVAITLAGKVSVLLEGR